MREGKVDIEILSRSELREDAGTLFLPFLLGNPHIFLVCDLFV